MIVRMYGCWRGSPRHNYYEVEIGNLRWESVETSMMERWFIQIISESKNDEKKAVVSGQKTIYDFSLQFFSDSFRQHRSDVFLFWYNERTRPQQGHNRIRNHFL